MFVITEKQPRGFEFVSSVKGNANYKLPNRKTENAAGYDFYLPQDVLLKPGQQIEIKSGIKAYMMNDEVLNIYPRSSLGIKYRTLLTNTVGIIDSDFYNNEENEGEITISLLNIGIKDLELKKGDRVCQGIFTKFLTCGDVVNNERKGGIGSTGN